MNGEWCSSDQTPRAIGPAFMGVFVALTLTLTPALPQPLVIDVGLNSPARFQVGEVMLVSMTPADASASVRFWDGAASTIPGTVLAVDPDRGFVAVRVPAGAKSGPAIIRVGGVDAAPYFIGLRQGTFDPGTVRITGSVTGPGGAPVEGALVALLTAGCEDMRLWDVARTDSSGAYAVVGKGGLYQLMAMAPRATTFVIGGALCEVTGSPIVQDLEVQPGVPVTGQVVSASDNTTPVPNALVSFDGNGHDQEITGPDGRFTVYVPPGDLEVSVAPPHGARYNYFEQEFTIPPAPTDLGKVRLDAAGVQIRGVVRNSAWEPLPGAWIHAVSDGEPCCTNYDGGTSAGDGSFAVTVPPNGSYHLRATFSQYASVADAMTVVEVGAMDVVRDLDAGPAAFVTGTIVDHATGAPVEGADVMARTRGDSASVAWTSTCVNGSYRLRIPPQTGLFIGAYHEERDYVPVAWNGTAAGTPFLCEGQLVTAGSAGEQISMPIELRQGARISGVFRSQASGCTMPTSGFWVTVDDGTDHQCGLGVSPDGMPGTNYTFSLLPPASMIPGLRACVSAPNVAPQCYDLRRPPEHNAILLTEGESRSGIDFCLGNVPTHEVQNLMVRHFPGVLAFSWSPSTDLYHAEYVLTGAAAPDGMFSLVQNTTATAVTIHDGSPWGFYLVRDRGATGIEGP